MVGLVGRIPGNPYVRCSILDEVGSFFFLFSFLEKIFYSKFCFLDSENRIQSLFFLINKCRLYLGLDLFQIYPFKNFHFHLLIGKTDLNFHNFSIVEIERLSKRIFCFIIRKFCCPLCSVVCESLEFLVGQRMSGCLQRCEDLDQQWMFYLHVRREIIFFLGGGGELVDRLSQKNRLIEIEPLRIDETKYIKSLVSFKIGWIIF